MPFCSAKVATGLSDLPFNILFLLLFSAKIIVVRLCPGHIIK